MDCFTSYAVSQWQGFLLSERAQQDGVSMRALVSSLLAKNLDRKELYGNRWCEYIALSTYFFIM
ncbi:hypothetical protein Nstercoris_01906 [Nitrosomonas stercoris]|uniref:Uncharacterized protein n=1 Tax=Nitrosomonas stercoris TaxID=1444684 RepID=A0A4Y1YN89_9PROT|nr:hypothetical protein Nstercoris_01906 [Nitrosomonas stercoris]